MNGGKGHDGDGDGRPAHVDGCPKGNGDRVGVLMEVESLAQIHVHRDVGSRASGKEGGDATLTQAGEHQGVWVAFGFEEDDGGVHNQGDDGHGSQENLQEVCVTTKGSESCGGNGLGDQAEDAKGGKSDDQLYNAGDAVGEIAEKGLCPFTRVLEGDAQGNGPGEDSDEVAGGEGVDGVVHDLEEQGVEDLTNAVGRGDGSACGHKGQVGWEEKA